MLFFLLVFQLLFSALAQPVNRVVIVSVDGLRSDGLQQVLDSGAPGFSSLWGDAATLDARADPDLTLTLPNHRVPPPTPTCMEEVNRGS